MRPHRPSAVRDWLLDAVSDRLSSSGTSLSKLDASRLYDRKRAQKRPGVRIFWIGWVRLAAATSASHAAA